GAGGGGVRGEVGGDGGGGCSGEGGGKMMPAWAVVSRRHVLGGTGALVFGFSSVPRLFGQESRDTQNLGKEPNQSPSLPGSLKRSPFLDSWIRIDADGAITVFTGKAELGQGIKTALLQIAAEELDVPLR